ncbi:MAG: GGDEF domain-containing protein [Sedimentisphaerales bacterium]|nr:GGDEF domain-containing protein [Sedimentisphaerales bacterium]
MQNTQSDRMTEQFYRSIVDSMFDAVFAVDKDIRITYWNKSCERLSGYSADEMLGQCFYKTPLGQIEGGEDNSVSGSRGGLRIAVETGMPGTWKGYIRRKTGQQIPIESRISPVFDENQEVVGAVEVFRDTSCQVLLEQAHSQALRTARHDELTGLLNRAAISQLLNTEIKRSRRYNQVFSLIMMDLDHFKNVNDKYGHDSGDKLLRAIGALLRDNLREPDMAGRWGGEEFLVLAPGSEGSGAEKLADRLRECVLGISIPEIPIAVSASFGVAQIAAEQTQDELLSVVDKALYLAKETGRNRVVLGCG